MPSALIQLIVGKQNLIYNNWWLKLHICVLALKNKRDFETDRQREWQSEGVFLYVTIMFLMGHSVARYACLLAPLTPLIALQHSALLARSVHGLTQFAHSLVRQLIFVNIKILELWVLAGQTALRNKRRTSNPRIVHGQRYPMPCLEWSNEIVEWEQGSGLKEPMSCRTQGGISRRPEG